MGLKDLFSRKKSDDDDDEEDDDFDAADVADGDAADGDGMASGGDGSDSDSDGEDPGFGGSSLHGSSADNSVKTDKPDDAQNDDAQDNEAAGTDVAVIDGDDAPDGDDAADFDEFDIEGEESDFDEDEDADDEGGLFENPIVLYSAIGAGVLLILLAVGVGGWMLLGSDDQETAEIESQASLNAIALPPVKSSGSGGLNDVSGQDDKPPESEALPTSTQSVGAGLLNSVPSAGGLNALAGGGLNSVGTGGSTTAGLIIQASTIASFEQFVDNPSPDPLSRAPDPDFLEILEDGAVALPKVASDGRLPWEFYSRPSDVAADSQRVAILITGLGLSQASTLSAIRKLPPAVTLSFSPYADDLDQWLLRSRRAGHEVILGLPLESSRFPIEDPGPMALQTWISDEENIVRLEAIMASFQGYIGFEVIMGSKFTSSGPHAQAMLDALNSRGLMILEGVWNNRSQVPKLAGDIGMPRAFSQVRLDTGSALSAFDAKLTELDALVATRNQAIATTGITPAILGRLKTWIQTLPEKNMKLVPVSALVTTKLTAIDPEL